MPNTHTHSHIHSVTRDTQDGWSRGQGSDAILTHASVARPLIKLMGYEQREDVLGVGGAGKGKHTHIHTHSVPRDTQGGWSLGQRTDAILTHVSVAPPLLKLVGYEHREDAVGGAKLYE